MSKERPKTSSQIQISKNTEVITKPFKSTDAEVESRVQEIVQLLTSGKDRPHILHYASSRWSVTERTAAEYYGRATARLIDIGKSKAELSLGIYLNVLWDNCERARQKEELGEVRQTIMSMAKLSGLDQQNIHLSIEKIDPDLQSLSTDEITLMLEEDE